MRIICYENSGGFRLTIKLKRIYEKRALEDGKRIFVERLWPRGCTKEDAKIDEWLKDVAPSSTLRKWYSHDQSKWIEFKTKYWSELKNEDAVIKKLKDESSKGTVTFLYASKEEKLNSAAALKEYIERMK